jgi:hypothetical protein
LTNSVEPPKLGRDALLALTQWVKKNNNRSACVEKNGLESNSRRKSFSLDQPLGANGAEANKNKKNQGRKK